MMGEAPVRAAAVLGGVTPLREKAEVEATPIKRHARIMLGLRGPRDEGDWQLSRGS